MGNSMPAEFTIEPLPHPVPMHLDAAEGWLLLGNAAEALAELDHIPAPQRDHPKALALEWRAWHTQGQPARAWYAAHRLCEILPQCSGAWICQANSLRELRGERAAARLLQPLVDRFPDDPIIPYNLACYLVHLEEWDAASKWLLRAFEIAGDSQLKAVALLDPDLKPLWEKIGRASQPA